MDYYSLPVKDVLFNLRTKPEGLTRAEVASRRLQYGRNELDKKSHTTPLKIFFSQFSDFLILLLLVATVISLILGEMLDAAAMIAIVLLAAALGFVQEYKAEKAMEALERISAPHARVRRDGKVEKIPASEVVPGDILLLEAGDVVPADARIIKESGLNIDEASLTGESVPSKKVIDPFPKETHLPDQENMAFMGTVVTYGSGEAAVVATGMSTEMGTIAATLQATKDVKTPLQKKFARMARQIGFGVIILVAIVFVAGLIRGDTSAPDLLIFALSLAVAAVPSSLPAIVTIGLSMGAKTLAKKNMIIKKLPATESLGSTTVICTDKTGTLTKNEMTVTRVFANNEDYTVEGTGYKPEGSIQKDGKRVPTNSIEMLLRTCVLCNNAELQHVKEWSIVGDPTEGALLVLARKGGLKEDELARKHEIEAELPFDSERKLMSVVARRGKDRKALVKGAPDILLKHCNRILINGMARTISPRDKKAVLDKNSEYASQALRVLGFAYRDIEKAGDLTPAEVERDLVFVGLAGMIDPARKEVKAAVRECREAGIKIIMITGDHPDTAKSVAEEIGLYRKNDLVITGAELEKIDDKRLDSMLRDISIIARARPIQKSRIVDALKRVGHVVAMTGDGINDAPALKKADIGIAMGITGTDVSKEVAKGILVDDNFATIVNAVEEGRNIYDKIIKSTKYLLSCNMGEIVSVFLAVILRFPLPLIPLQILLMNLLTDGLPALGLSYEPSDEDVMKRPPRDPSDHPLTKNTLLVIVMFGLLMGVGTLFVFHLFDDLVKAQTMAFTTLVCFEMFAVLGNRSLMPFRKLNPFSNLWLLGAVCISIAIQLLVIYVPFLQPVFGTVPISLADWGLIIGVSFTGFLLMELSKITLSTKSLYIHTKS